MRMNKPTQKRRGYEQIKKKQKFGGSSSEKNGKKIIQWSPLWIIFKGKIEIAHLLTEQSAGQDYHFFLQT